ncbi:Cleavage and polyadenylation specificity factor subunit 2 like protein [Aduncisulcus paluster]|nr:Cleavage and polyadenylation specificity factor subunit 2 like protein [Aduncisulcus paluster]
MPALQKEEKRLSLHSITDVGSSTILNRVDKAPNKSIMIGNPSEKDVMDRLTRADMRVLMKKDGGEEGIEIRDNDSIGGKEACFVSVRDETVEIKGECNVTMLKTLLLLKRMYRNIK